MAPCGFNGLALRPEFRRRSAHTGHDLQLPLRRLPLHATAGAAATSSSARGSACCSARSCNHAGVRRCPPDLVSGLQPCRLVFRSEEARYARDVFSERRPNPRHGHDRLGAEQRHGRPLTREARGAAIRVDGHGTSSANAEARPARGSIDKPAHGVVVPPTPQHMRAGLGHAAPTTVYQRQRGGWADERFTHQNSESAARLQP